MPMLSMVSLLLYAWNPDRHVLNVTNIFNGIAAIARPEFDRQTSFVASMAIFIEMASGVKIATILSPPRG